MRMTKYVAIVAVLVLAGCSSSAKPQSAGDTNPASTTTAPKGLPGAPREVSAAPNGNAVAKLFWKAPKSSGSSAIKGYVVTPFIGKQAQTTKAFASTATTQSIANLTNGAKYRFEVAAVNNAGRGPFSTRSGTMTVGAPGIPQHVAAAKSGQGSLKISFGTPGDSGADITSFTASCTSSNGGAAKKHQGTASPLRVTGLTAGKTYACTVTATNSRGTGPPSQPTKATAV
jgi:hypothetical protein